MFRHLSSLRKSVLLSVSYVSSRPVGVRSLQAMTSLSSRRKIGTSGYLLLIIPTSAFCLGCWQVQRREWKLQIIEELQSKVNKAPVPLPERLDNISEMEYQRVLITGTFNHDREMLYGPRPPLISGQYKETGTLVSTGSSGYLVVTPFTLTDSGTTILINRGWVSKQQRKPEHRLQGQVEGEQTLSGVVRTEESRPPFMPKDHDNANFFLYRDIVAMGQTAGCAPVFLDACEGVRGGPVAGQTRVTLRNEHLSYVFTWYSLSVVTAFLWYRRYINIRALL